MGIRHRPGGTHKGLLLLSPSLTCRVVLRNYVVRCVALGTSLLRAAEEEAEHDDNEYPGREAASRESVSDELVSIAVGRTLESHTRGNVTTPLSLVLLVRCWHHEVCQHVSVL